VISVYSDFTISYQSQDNGQDVYLSMLSDWDMDAAFQNASDPCLKLKVDLRPFDEGNNYYWILFEKEVYLLEWTLHRILWSVIS